MYNLTRGQVLSASYVDEWTFTYWIDNELIHDEDRTGRTYASREKAIEEMNRVIYDK